MMRLIYTLIMITIICLAADSWAENANVKRWAFGVSTDDSLLRTETPALSALYFKDADSFIHGSFVMTSSDPSELSLGAYYKKNLYGSLRNGGHIGIGYGTGTFDSDGSFWRINADAGFHFIIEKNVFISFDASLSFGKDENPNDNVFRIGGNSTLLGLSVFWIP